MGGADMAGFSIVMLQFLLIYLLVLGFVLLWSIAAYIMSSLSLHTIAKRRGISKPWLAWVPIANVWIVGSISDQFRYVTRGQLTNKRKVLLGLFIAVIALMIVMLVPYISMITLVVSNIDSTMTDAQLYQMMGYAMVILAVAMVMVVVSIVYAVFYYIALYDVYRSCKPDNATLFLVLTILLGVVYPFFLLSCRKMDLGMPPRTNVDSAALPPEQ
jgi:hypothetical protein